MTRPGDWQGWLAWTGPQAHDRGSTHGRREAHVSAAEASVPSSDIPDSRPEGRKAGHDRRPPGSNQRWRHVRSGIVACVVYVAPDKSYLYTDASGTAWPMEMFLARWERL